MRIADSRVSLDSVLHHYQQGATAEEIALRFPALRLADIHACLAYYLNHQDTIGEYLGRQQKLADDLRERVSADTNQQQGITRMRERIKKRLATIQQQPS